MTTDMVCVDYHSRQADLFLLLQLMKLTQLVGRSISCCCTWQNIPGAVMLANAAGCLWCFWGLDFVHQNVSMIHMTAVLLS